MPETPIKPKSFTSEHMLEWFELVTSKPMSLFESIIFIIKAAVPLLIMIGYYLFRKQELEREQFEFQKKIIVKSKESVGREKSSDDDQYDESF